jgi:hypothetical protein
MALANLDSEETRGDINLIATYLLGRQNANGSWDYTSRQHGDTSISQYALLGLWECENAGFEVPPSVWDNAASWYISVQGPSGSWNYHRDQPEYQENVSMTAAGVGSLLICKRQLERFRQQRRGNNPLLTALAPEKSNLSYEIKTSSAKIDQAVASGIKWMAANYSTTNSNLIGQSMYYGLYGIERVSAFADRQTLGKVDLMEKGRNYIHTTQHPDGSYQREGPEALRPFKDRFRKMLSDRDAGVRQVAAWALSRTADLDVVPDLIGALVDPEENVVVAARLGLQLLSRKIDGLGPSSPSTPAERQDAAARWRAWYDSIHPLEADADQDKPRRTEARQPAAAQAARPKPPRSSPP